jgi:predicted HicB family RNase H-like nuclease
MPAQLRQQVGARVTATVYRQLKARAALQGVAVGTLVEQAISEFMERTAGSSQDAA